MPSRKRTPLPTLSRTLDVAGEAGAIRTATEDDVTYILDQARRWSNEMGFIPAEGMRRLVTEGRGFIAELNGDPAGYILTSGGLRTPMVVRHNTVSEDVWSRGLGTLLMSSVLDWAARIGCRAVNVRTRVDICRQVAINRRLNGFVLGQDSTVGQRGEPVQTWRIQRDPMLPLIF